MKTRRRRIAFVIGVAFAFYCLGYVGARLTHKVVHRISSDAAGNYTWHDVAGGNDLDAPLGEVMWNDRMAVLYTPLRYLELGWWHVSRPIGSPLTDDQKRSFGLLPDTNSPPSTAIPWDQAVEMIKNGQVTCVVQSHSLDVGLCTTNGVWYHTTEPSIDAVFASIRQHAPNKITEITE